MSITLVTVRHLAHDVIRQQSADLTVIGVTAAEGHRNQAEVLLARAKHGGEPALFMVRVRRDRSESDLRQELRRLLREHLESDR